jgi:4-amino-4-deoxy-L-arabinose transferase-like glycosyltransferase
LDLQPQPEHVQPGPQGADASLWKRRCAAVVVVFAVLFLACIPFRDFRYPDEPDVAEVTRQMLVTGDWLRLQWHGETFADYPPLFFWLAGASAKAGGLNEFALRLPSVLAGLGLLAATMLWAWRRLGPSAAFWSGVALGTSYYGFHQSVNMHVDMMLAFFFGAGIFFFDFSRDAKGRRRVLLIGLSALAMGAASLTKGPAGIVLPCGILALDAMLRRQWRTLLTLCAAGFVASLIFAAWSAAYARHAGADNLIYFIFKQNISRFLEGHSHRRSAVYFLLSVFVDSLPWSLFLIPALPAAWRAARNGDRASGLLLAWFAVVLVFFSISSSKRGVYALPVYPAMAAIVGRCVADVLAKGASRRSFFGVLLWILAAIFICAGIAAVVAVGRLRQELPEAGGFAYPLAALTLVFVIGGAFMLVSLARNRAVSALCAVPLVAALGYSLALGWLEPTLDGPMSGKDDALLLRRYIDPSQGEVMGVFCDTDDTPKEVTVLSFYGGMDCEVLRTREEVQSYLDRQPGDPILVRDDMMGSLEKLGPWKWETMSRHRVGSDFYVCVRPARNGR